MNREAHRPTSRPLAALILAHLSAPSGHAQLDLPRKTIVVRDFARLRQDLLDTLLVNIPGADVEIVQFRGAEVVLAVEFLVQKAPADPIRAERQLREHCDRLIRAAAPVTSLRETWGMDMPRVYGGWRRRRVRR